MSIAAAAAALLRAEMKIVVSLMSPAMISQQGYRRGPGSRVKGEWTAKPPSMTHAAAGSKLFFCYA